MTGSGGSRQPNEGDCTSGLSDMTEEGNPKSWWKELVSGVAGVREAAESQRDLF